MTPRLCEADRRLVAEIMAIRREVSPAERRRLPTVRQIAERFNACEGLVYRIAKDYPYKRVHPKDRANNVSRGTNNHQGISQ